METRQRHAGIFAPMFLVGVLLASASPARPEGDSPEKITYLKYCSACHGANGKGDGVVSGFMRPRPTDLTKIGSKADFPFMKVAQTIDGTTLVRAHGDPDMPVWGEIFRSESGGGSALSKQAQVRSKVMAITQYVRSIQEK